MVLFKQNFRISRFNLIYFFLIYRNIFCFHQAFNQLLVGFLLLFLKKILCNLYDQMPDPKAVIAIGTCALSGGVFRDTYNVVGGVDKVIPVDVYVPGCAAKPEAIIDGVVLALEKFTKKLGRRVSKERELMEVCQ